MDFNGEGPSMLGGGSGSDTDIKGDLTVGGVIQTSDGTVTKPAYSFTSDPSTGFFRTGTGSVAFASGLQERVLFDSDGLHVEGDLDVKNITVDEQFLAPDGSDATPSYSFADEQSTGFERSGTGEVAFVAGGSKRMRISPTEMKVDVPLTTGTQGITSGPLTASTLTTAGLLTAGSATIPTLSTGTVSATTVNVSGTTTSGTVAATTVNVSGTTTSGTLTATSTVRTPTIINPATTPISIQSNNGTTSSGMAMVQFDALSPNGTQLYGIGVNKAGYGVTMMGVSRVATFGELPGNSSYLCSYNTADPVTIGRGSAGTPWFADVKISGSTGSVACTNGTFSASSITGTTAALTTLTATTASLTTISGSTLSLSSQAKVRWKLTGIVTIADVSATPLVAWNSTPLDTRGTGYPVWDGASNSFLFPAVTSTWTVTIQMQWDRSSVGARSHWMIATASPSRLYGWTVLPAGFVDADGPVMTSTFEIDVNPNINFQIWVEQDSGSPKDISVAQSSVEFSRKF